MTLDELIKIADEREAWAKAEPTGPRPAEWMLTAELAREVIEYRETYGALSERGFLTR